MDALHSGSKAYKRDVRRAKRESWKLFVNNIQKPKGMALLNSILKARENKILGILKRPDGSFCATPEESMDLLIDTHFPGNASAEARGEANHSSSASFSREDVESCAIISAEKVQAAVKSLGPHKAPGPDEIKPLVFQNLGAKMLTRLARLYQAILTLGYTPRKWRTSKVIFIPKPGKDDYAQPKSFRPISLMPVFYKILERLCLWEIEETALKVSPISSAQHGFKKGFSTETALSTLVDLIEKAMARGEYALVTFLDIEGAFDNVSYDSVELAMKEKNVNPLITKWYTSYLRDRYMHTEISGEERRRALTKGVPQGGVISPLAWNLVFDSLLKVINHRPFKGIGLADDGAIGMSGIDPGMMMQQMQTALNRALEWGEATGLRFSAKKTLVMLFTRKRKKPRECTLKMGQQKLCFATQVKYLGITLDDKLLWSLHVKNKVAQAKGHLVRVKNAIGKLWGPHPGAIVWAYKAIVAPALTYGSLVWAHATHKGYAQRSLTRLSRLAGLSTGHYLRGTPTAGLEVALGLVPLDLVAQNLGLNAYCRWREILPSQEQASHAGHLKRWKAQATALNIHDYITDDVSPRPNWERRYTVSDCTDGLADLDYDVVCYTDGSKMEDRVGWGAYITFSGTHFTGQGALCSSATVYQAELYALLQACEFVKNLQGKSVIIHTDNNATLWALKAPFIASTSVIRCRDALNNIGATRSVTLKWIKAHAGHLGNEKADAAAKLGCEATRITQVPVATQVVKTVTKSCFMKQWSMRWQQRTDCRQTKLWFPKLDAESRAKSKTLVALSRENISLAIQFITGFNRLNKHQNTCNPMEVTDPECRYCMEDDESAWHVLAECPALGPNRIDVFDVPFLQHVPSWTTTQLVHFITMLRESLGSE